MISQLVSSAIELNLVLRSIGKYYFETKRIRFSIPKFGIRLRTNAPTASNHSSKCTYRACQYNTIVFGPHRETKRTFASMYYLVEFYEIQKLTRKNSHHSATKKISWPLFFLSLRILSKDAKLRHINPQFWRGPNLHWACSRFLSGTEGCRSLLGS